MRTSLTQILFCFSLLFCARILSRKRLQFFFGVETGLDFTLKTLLKPLQFFLNIEDMLLYTRYTPQKPLQFIKKIDCIAASSSSQM